MIKKVFKYELAVNDAFPISMPKGAEILTVQVQKGVPCLWALVDPETPEEVRHFRMAGTGHCISCNDERFNYKYISSFQLGEGSLIFHVFEGVFK
jgi:hypothetical protein